MAKKKKTIVEIAREKMAKAKEDKNKHIDNAQLDIEILNALKDVVRIDIENLCTKFDYKRNEYKGIKLQEIENKSIWLLNTLDIVELTEDTEEVNVTIDSLFTTKKIQKSFSNMTTATDIYVVSLYDVEICGKSICDTIDAYGAFHKNHADRLVKKHKSAEYKIGIKTLRNRLEANSTIDE